MAKAVEPNGQRRRVHVWELVVAKEAVVVALSPVIACAALFL